MMNAPGQPEEDPVSSSPESAFPVDRQAVDRLFSAAYEELRRLAGAVRQSHAAATLSPTALVHEAWLKLAKSPEFSTSSELHFKRIAARAMRQVLIDAARRRTSVKRGGDALIGSLLVEDSANGFFARSQDLLALEDALNELERVEPRQALIVETRFFGGFDITETAALLAVSESTANREWRVARAWLAHQLSKGI